MPPIQGENLKPNKKQLSHLFNILLEHKGRIGFSESVAYSTSQKIWDFVEGELNKVYPLPFEHGRMLRKGHSYKCNHCHKKSLAIHWDQNIAQNVTQLTCPECGAVHSEMIKGDDQ